RRRPGPRRGRSAGPPGRRPPRRPRSPRHRDSGGGAPGGWGRPLRTLPRGVTPTRLDPLALQGLRAFLPLMPIALHRRDSLLASLCMKFRSPLRGPWLTSVLGVVLLAALPLVIVTGLLGS